MLERIVSGGQTGVDRAALDAALRHGLAIGGWCPRGRLAEDGMISEAYPLRETPSMDYAERTMWNVRDSDGTLVLCHGEATGGTAYTLACTRILKKPHCVVDLSLRPTVADTVAWLREEQVRVLNVAGPRESTAPGVHALALDFLDTLLCSTGCGLD